MNIHWDSLLAVFLVSLGSAVAVVVLVGLALLGLSARTAVADGPQHPIPQKPVPLVPALRKPVPSWRSRAAGTAAAVACLTLAAAIVLAGLWVVVAR